MTYLLDTCIISKMSKMKRDHDIKLQKWIAKHDESSYFLSVATIGEIQAGISKLTKSDEKRKKMILEEWLIADLIPRFQGRILPIDEMIAKKWGQITGEAKSKGICIPAIDALIAATAAIHQLIVVTENGKDFHHSGVTVFNPYL